MQPSLLRFATPFALALAMVACKPSAPAAVGPEAGAPSPSTPPRSIVQAHKAKADTCPDTDFTAFLKRFEGSADVQRASAAEVVTMDSIDADALPEPKPVTKQVSRNELKFPVMLTPAQRQAEGLVQTITANGQIEQEVKHAVPDSGVQTRFSFQATPCWTLVRISDDTI